MLGPRNISHNELSFPFKKNALDYLIVYIAYAMGGIYFFYLKAPPKIYFFLFLLIVALNKRIQLRDAKLAFLFLILFGIFYTQKIIYGRGTLSNFLGMIINLANAYLIIKIVNKKFFYLLINVVYVFAIIGLVFWILENVSSAFNNSIQPLVGILGTDPSEQQESLILFAYEPNFSLDGLVRRNNGGFWEPGAYVTTLVPAYFFSLTIYGFKNIKSIVILIATFTTFSTTGILALFVILFYYIMISPKINKKAKFGIFLVLLVSASVSFFSFDFLFEKIAKEIQYADSRELTDGTDGRFSGLKKAIYSVQQHPFIGKDFITLKGEEIDYFAKDYVGYGWMMLLAKIGVFFFSWYLLINLKFYRRFFNANIPLFKGSILFILPFLAQYILLFGQALYNVPLFDIFFLLPLLYKSEAAYKLI